MFSGSFKYLLGGIVIGAIGTLAVCKNKDKIQPLADNLMNYAKDAKDGIAKKISLTAGKDADETSKA